MEGRLKLIKGIMVNIYMELFLILDKLRWSRHSVEWNCFEQSMRKGELVALLLSFGCLVTLMFYGSFSQ